MLGKPQSRYAPDQETQWTTLSRQCGYVVIVVDVTGAAAMQLTTLLFAVVVIVTVTAVAVHAVAVHVVYALALSMHAITINDIATDVVLLFHCMLFCLVCFAKLHQPSPGKPGRCNSSMQHC